MHPTHSTSLSLTWAEPFRLISYKPGRLRFSFPCSVQPNTSISSATPLREKSTHVLHLTEENKKLEDELRRMNERLQAAEQKSKALKNATTA
jgi:hypothetical protein